MDRLRFWSWEALANSDGVISTILAAIEERQTELAS